MAGERDSFQVLDPNEPQLSGDMPHPFENEMLAIVNADFDRATRYRRESQQRVLDFDQQYHNAAFAKVLEASGAMPVPIGQQLCDQLRNSLMDKLLFAGRPCKTMGREDTDKDDAEAKQEYMDWLDYDDNVEQKLSRALSDCAVLRNCVGVVDYDEQLSEEWVPTTEHVDAPERQTFMQKLRSYLPTKPKLRMVKQTVPTFMGATVRMVDVRDVFWGPDKQYMSDPFPIMLRSDQTKAKFQSESYFRNVDLIEDKVGANVSDTDEFKLKWLGNTEARQTSQQPYKYVEWFGPANKKKLYEYLSAVELDPKERALYADDGSIKDTEVVWCVCGVVDARVVVRLKDVRHGTNGPPVVMGCIECGDSPFDAVAIMDKIYSICRAADNAAGQMKANIEQNIDSMWLIWADKLADPNPVVNKRGGIVLTKAPVGEVAQRIEMIPQVRELMELLAMYMQWARDASNIQSIATGRGDPNAETLGEAGMVESYGRLGLDDYFNTFVRTFVIPLYRMRNQVNAQNVTREFAFRIIGEKAGAWRTVTTDQVRAAVDFVCESSSRETNRAVQTQQLLSAIDKAASVQALGFTPRVDYLFKLLLENGMTVSQEMIKKILPTIAYEEDSGIDLGQIIAQTDLVRMGVNLQMLQAGGQAITAQANGKTTEQPLTEADAAQSANAKTQPNVRQSA